MSALKTVERSQKLSSLQKKLDTAAWNVKDYSAQLQTTNRKLDSTIKSIDDACQLRELHTKGRLGGLSGANLKKAEVLDDARNTLIQKCDNLSKKQKVLEIKFAEEADVAVAEELEKVKDELVKSNNEIDSISREIGKMIKIDKDELDVEIAELTVKKNELLDNRDFFEKKHAENTKELSELKEKLGGLKDGVGKRFNVNALVKSGAVLGVNTVKGVVKSEFTKVDPLSGGINKSDVTDTGNELFGGLARCGTRPYAEKNIPKPCVNADFNIS
jgi:hypothetical protein